MINIGLCSYSFHARAFYSEHKTGLSDYLIRLQTEGTCEIIVKGKRYHIEKGHLLLIKPGDHYEILVKDGQNSGDYFLMCKGDWIDRWWDRSVKHTVSRIELDDKLLNIWRHIIIEQRRPSSELNSELTNYLTRALCISIERSINETSSSYTRPYVVTRMMRYIEEHAFTPFKINDVAAHVGLSVSRAVHLFKLSLDKTMIEYAQEIRLSAAIDQMKYTMFTLDQIAENCGFGSYPYFHKVFRKKYGISPGVYRRQE
ncbi:helix-turn-helix transcriptional regulator [Evansella cellulosilytica]|uniref:Transcriptional regulator, AraC family n=1 Tax=Evansella cellulosilytica (strain ATCC 21833 / DSM 2522 / FERM P-1141 / JCM 9156 / N-4) TaxID=649639 RepID=E6TQL6_EVAC2|nr:AraC family transcriptional regulator [Evansella cellulosilytica]ADU30527.1 transcriptional regulator, AraC family [Evansella cellulosilytica DSM 2522]